MSEKATIGRHMAEKKTQNLQELKQLLFACMVTLQLMIRTSSMLSNRLVQTKASQLTITQSLLILMKTQFVMTRQLTWQKHTTLSLLTHSVTNHT